MTQSLDNLYLEWLYRQVGSVKQRNPSKTYWSLMRQLFTKEFVWFVPNDDNRLVDGCDLRSEFIFESELDDIDPNWLGLGCSMLEIMVGLSRRLSFEGEGDPRDWFWLLVNNIELTSCTDTQYRIAPKEREVNEVLDRIIWRTYSRDGVGGFFPLERPQKDQRKVELWYQLSAYLLERD